jgi:hypothetical protein
MRRPAALAGAFSIGLPMGSRLPRNWNDVTHMLQSEGSVV